MEGGTPIVIGTLRLECLMLEFDGRRYLANALLDEEGRHQLLSGGFWGCGFPLLVVDGRRKTPSGSEKLFMCFLQFSNARPNYIPFLIL